MTSRLSTGDRLQSLPPKVRVPLEHLLEADLVSSDVVERVMDAGELAGDTNHLLGFAIAYLHLESQGVPMRDVISMARAQGRRLKLAWSANRWKLEHHRLGRAEALARLSAVNIRYDLSKVEAHLPRRFNGYLIRTSRRLGVEGLRQRHCVASYHEQILAGHCALASVFVARQRWTVQLVPTGRAQAPLRIVQIKTQLNGVPSNDVRERIHAELGIAPDRAIDVTPVDPPPEHLYMENLRRVLPVLRLHGVTRVEVSFDGSGDSGSIGDINFGDSRFDGSTVEVEIVSVNRVFESGSWVSIREVARKNLNAALEDLTNDYLEETGVDWYNNDGGFGTLVIDVAAGTVALEVSVRYTESSCEFSMERDILTGEEVEN